MPALEQSYYLLAGHPAVSRHIILLSDGRTYPDSYEEMVGQIQRAGITVSTVGIGAGADQELLTQIAEWGDGRSYFAIDPRQLPTIFLEETLRMQTSVTEETLNLKIRRPVEFLTGIPLETAPALSGIVRVKARPEGEVIVETTAEDPVLARWRYGLGTVLFLAADLGERWTADWLKWPYLTRLTSQLVRASAGTVLEPALDWRVERLDGIQVQVQLQARDEAGMPLPGLEPIVEVTHGGQTQHIALEAELQGLYRAEFALGLQDTALVRLTEPTVDQVQTILPQYPKEFRHQPADLELLRRICQQSGGIFDPGEEDLLQAGSGSTTRSRQLWPLLSGLALLSFLIEIAVRRLPV
jgi:hypothetical protein